MKQLDLPPPARYGLGWDLLECVEVVNYCRYGETPAQAAKLLQRTVSAVESKAYGLAIEELRKFPADVRWRAPHSAYPASIANRWIVAQDIIHFLDKERTNNEPKPGTERRDQRARNTATVLRGPAVRSAGSPRND